MRFFLFIFCINLGLCTFKAIRIIITTLTFFFTNISIQNKSHWYASIAAWLKGIQSILAMHINIVVHCTSKLFYHAMRSFYNFSSKIQNKNYSYKDLSTISVAIIMNKSFCFLEKSVDFNQQKFSQSILPISNFQCCMKEHH